MNKYETERILERYSFDDFVPGASCNRFSLAISLAVSQRPGEIYNPLYLYGDSGVGKSHLLKAIEKEILRQFPDKKVLHITAEQFANDFISSIKEGNRMDFKNKYRHDIEVLLIDDIQFIIGKTQTQKEFLRTFDSLYMEGKQVIITSDIPPKQLTLLEAGLQSRFAMGIISNISPPDYETRILIIQHILKRDYPTMHISNKEILFTASNLPGNVRTIEGALMTLTARYDFCEKLGCEKPSIEKILADMLVKRDTITADEIINKVARYYNVSAREIVAENRNADVVSARHISIYLMHKMLNMSYSEIAKYVKKNHTTVIYAINKIELMLNEDNKMVNIIQTIRDEIQK